MRKYRDALTILGLVVCIYAIELKAGWGAESKSPPGQKTSPRSSEDLTNLWFEALRILQEGVYEEAKHKLTEVNNKKHELGLDNLMEASDVLVRESNLLKKKGNFTAAMDFLEIASKLSPYNPRVRFALAKLHLSNLDLYRSFKEFFRGLKDKILDIDTFFSSLNQISIIFALSLSTAFSMVIVFSFMQVHRAVFHDVKEWFPGSLPILLIYIAGWLLFALVLWIGGLFWFVLLLSILTWGYLDFRGKKFIQAFLIFVFFLPLILLVIGITFSVYNSPYIKALKNITYGVYTEETEEALKRALESDPSNLKASFSLAFINKRKGLLEEGKQGYSDLSNRLYRLDKVYNNLGNIYYAQGKLDEAIKSYENALGENPNMFSAHYNLAQAYLQNVAFSEKAAAELNEAQRLDFNRFNEIREIAGNSSHYNLVLVDETLPRYTLFTSSLGFWSQGYEASRKIWGLFSRLENPLYLLVIAPMAWILIKVLDQSKQRSGYAYYCQMCGDPVCSYCRQTGSNRKLCMQCNYIFAKKSVLKPGKKEEKVRQIRNYEQTRKWSARVISILLPGSGHIYSGYIEKGFVIGILAAVLFFTLYFQGGVLRAYTGILPGNTFLFFLGELMAILGVYLFTLWDIFSLSPKN